LKEMNLERVNILAHSYGAFLAIHFSSEHPSRVSNLVLADAAGVFPTLGSYGAYWAFIFKASPISRFCRLFGVWPILAWFKALGCGANYFYWYSVLSSPDGWGDIHLSKFITVGWCRAFWNKPAFDLLVKLSEKVPVATVYGELDEIIPSHQGEIIRDSLGIPFTLIKNAGHSPIHGEDAKHFSEAVLSSLSSNRYSKDHSYGIRPFFGEPSSSGWEEKYSSSFCNLQTKRVISRLYSDILTN
jgi:pimeloyl-ACP methyl ester carboxylesterase